MSVDFVLHFLEQKIAVVASSRLAFHDEATLATPTTAGAAVTMAFVVVLLILILLMLLFMLTHQTLQVRARKRAETAARMQAIGRRRGWIHTWVLIWFDLVCVASCNTKNRFLVCGLARAVRGWAVANANLLEL